MKSLFRSIRRKLLDEGKLLRYLTYALGEIVLIVVGILLALKVNDWNEDRKAQAEFDEYIVQLKEDVKLAIDRTKRNEGFSKEASPQHYSILQFLDGDPKNDPSQEAFEEALVSLTRFTPTNIHIGHFGRLLSGDIEIISRSPVLTDRALDIQVSIGSFLTVINDMRDERSVYAEITDRYIVTPYSLVPEVKLSYDLEKMRRSEEFQYAVYKLSRNKHTYNLFLNRILEELDSFHILLEEHDVK